MNKILTEQERLGLRALHKKERDRRIADRIKAVLLYDKGWSYQEIAEALMLDEETIRNQIKEYQESKKLRPENGGSFSKLTHEQTVELISHLESHTYFYSKEICAYIKEKYGVEYTVPGITSWLKNNGFSYKRPKGVPAKADPEAQKNFIEVYKKLLEDTPENEPIEFGDGVHPTMATKISCGWIKKGVNKPIGTTASRTRINLFGSINLKNLKNITINEYKTIDSSSMEKHFQKLRDKYPDAPLIHLILDNGPYNKSEETRKAAERYKIKLHYLPTYSPNLNPIERLWKVMNEHVRNNVYFASVHEFKNAIHNFFDKTWLSMSDSMKNTINDNFYIVKTASSS